MSNRTLTEEQRRDIVRYRMENSSMIGWPKNLSIDSRPAKKENSFLCIAIT